MAGPVAVVASATRPSIASSSSSCPWPIIRSISQCLSTSAAGAVAMRRLFRNTVTVSATSSTSSRKCEMKMKLVPSRLSSRSTANRRAISGGESAEVGSSRMMIRAPLNSTRPSSTSCCSPSGSRPVSASGSIPMPRRSRCFRASCAIARQRTRPAPLVSWWPRNTFSATLNPGTIDSSWCTIPMPAASASLALRKWTGRPSSRISPE